MVIKLNELEVNEAILEYVTKRIKRKDIDTFNTYTEIYFDKDIKKDLPLGSDKNASFECDVYIEGL